MPLARLLLVSALLLLVACGSGPDGPSSSGAPAEGAAGEGGTLVVAPQFAPRGGYAIETDDAFLLGKLGVVETLVEAGVDGGAQPRLATSWTQTSATTWDFTLREGVTFQDGTPLDADAVVTALEHVTGVETPPRAIASSGLTAEAVDAGTVRVTTAEPDPVLPLRLSSPATGILAPAAYRADPASAIGTGTGPFALTEVRDTSSATLVRHEGYWGERPALDGAEVRYLPDPAARVSALLAGDVQVAEGVPATALAELEGRDGVSVEQYTAPRTTTLYTNLESPALQDVRVRQALALAVDRPLLVETVLEGTGEPAAGIFGDAVGGSSDTPPAADPDAARALLAEAGFDDASPLTLRLWTYPDRPELPDLATAVQGMLEQAGVRTEIQIAEYASLEPAVLAGDFDLFVLSRSYLTDFPDAAGFLTSDYTCEGSYNLNRFCSAEVDALIASLSQVSDATARAEVFREVADRLAEQQVGVPLLHTGAITAVDASVGGFEVDPLERRLLTPALSLS